MLTIVDYGMGNVGSIRNMYERVGIDSVVSSDPDEIRTATRLILPGVGASDQAIATLNERGLSDVLRELAIERRIPTLGICLGMQLLTRSSEEGVLPCLGIVNGHTIKLKPLDGDHPLRIPHMGWNTVDVHRDGSIIRDTDPFRRFYFVHSYHVVCNDAEDVLATTRYGIDFCAAFQRGSVFGTQFHPEKSHKYGMDVLRRFAEWTPGA